MNDESIFETDQLETYPEFANYEPELYGEFEGEANLSSQFGDEFELFDTELVEETPAVAPHASQRIQQHRAAHAALTKAIGSMGRHVTRRDGRFGIRLPARNLSDAAAKLQAHPRVIQALLGSLRRRNALASSAQRRQGELDRETGATACPGRTAVTTHWWGVNVWLNECHTKALTSALTAGAGVGGLCAATFPVPQVKLACTVLGALGGIGAAVITGIDSFGGNKGIVIRKPWVTPPGLPPVVVWHQ
jgi:hypothetical protein